MALQTIISAALATPYETTQRAVQAAAVVNVDETGWKEAGRRRWLWVVVSATVTLFQVACGRGAGVVRHLLGAEYDGIVTSDRLKTYRCLDVNRRQLCWAHLIRNLLALAERKGALGAWAADLLALADLMFGVWHRFRAGAIDREMLQAALAPIQVAMRAILERGQRRYDQAQGLSEELLTLWPALWTFAVVEGVEPTTIAAERALRPAVLWRKKSFGAQSEAGNTFVEGILTVRATCAQQGRHLLTFLTEAVQAHWARHPAPKLLLPS